MVNFSSAQARSPLIVRKAAWHPAVQDHTMNFAQSIKHGYRSMTDVRSRAAPSEFYYFFIYAFVLLTVFGLLFRMFQDYVFAGGEEVRSVYYISVVVLYLIAVLLVQLPLITVSVRRLHDINLSWAWYLPYLILHVLTLKIGDEIYDKTADVFNPVFILNAVINVIFLITMGKPGTDGANGYGAQPGSSGVHLPQPATADRVTARSGN